MRSLGEQNYEHFAQRYAEQIGTKPFNAYLERPNTLSLLPDVKGMRVLDAGCGPGLYSEWLVDHGAEVVAVDVTSAFVKLAGRRLQGRATVLEADLSRRLDFAADVSFDLVLSSLVLHYIEDWRPVFAEFYRILKPDGLLVFSVMHPFSDYLYYTENISTDCSYFDTMLMEASWKSWGEPYPLIKSYRRPLGAMLNPLIDAGFRLDLLLEALPTEQFREASPGDYEKCIKQPFFLCIRAVKGLK